MTIVNTMNIYKDNDFKNSINKIRVIINNNVKNKTDKKKIDIKKKKKHTDYQIFVKKNMQDIKKKHPVNERKKVLSFYGKNGKKIVWILMYKN